MSYDAMEADIKGEQPLWAVSFWGNNTHIELHFKTEDRAREVIGDFYAQAKTLKASDKGLMEVVPVVCYYEDDFGQEAVVTFPFFIAAKAVNVWDFNYRSKFLTEKFKEMQGAKVGFGA